MILQTFYIVLVLVLSTLIRVELSQVTPCNVVLVSSTNNNSIYGVIITVRAKVQPVYRLSVNLYYIGDETVSPADKGRVNFLGVKNISTNETTVEKELTYQIVLPEPANNTFVGSVFFNGREVCNTPRNKNQIFVVKLSNVLKGKNICSMKMRRSKRWAQYHNNPFLSGSISVADKYASNPFLQNLPRPGNTFDINPSNPWLSNLGNNVPDPTPNPSNPWLSNLGNNVPDPTPAPTPPSKPPTTPPPETYPCGRSKVINNRLIIRGEATQKYEWPWAVGIFHKKLGSLDFQCGGTLISGEYVVTAGHCVVKSNGDVLSAEDLSVVVGLYDIQEWLTDDSIIKNVIEVILHPSYERNSLKNDIALLKFQYAIVTFSKNAIPACLWSEDQRSDSVFGEFGTIVGWGRDENGLRTTPTPRLTRQKVVTLEDCQESNPLIVQFTSSKTLCAGNRNGSGPCNGDSGSGMYFYINGKEAWYLRAIVSTSLSNPETPYACNVQDYVVYTDIAKYLSWINYYI